MDYIKVQAVTGAFGALGLTVLGSPPPAPASPPPAPTASVAYLGRGVKIAYISRREEGKKEQSKEERNPGSTPRGCHLVENFLAIKTYIRDFALLPPLWRKMQNKITLEKNFGLSIECY